jgi:hypothetical protein
LEERRTQTNSFNVVFGARFGARVFRQAFAVATELAGGSKAPVHFRQRRISLGLSLSPLWRARLSITLPREKFELATMEHEALVFASGFR